MLLVSMTFYDLDLLLFQADVESVAFYKTVFGYVAAAFIVICTLIFAKFRRYYSLLLCVGLFLLPILIEKFQRLFKGDILVHKRVSRHRAHQAKLSEFWPYRDILCRYRQIYRSDRRLYRS